MIVIKIYKIPIAVLLWGCFFLWGCENTKSEIDQATKKKLGIEEAVNVDMNYTLGGKVKAKLLSPLMLRVEDTLPYMEFPKKIHVDFYNDSTKIESILDAKYARYIESQSKILLKDSVRFIGLQNGDTLYCDELYWDRNRAVYQFYTDKPAVIKTKTQLLFCKDGLEVSQDFKEKLFHSVHDSYFRVPASQFPEY
jgi:hypothetical protein